MNLISGINLTSSALNAEKIRMEVVAENIANAQTTHDVNGQAYQRKVVSFESVLGGSGKGVRVGRVSTDPTPGEAVFNPTHPDANKDGMVQMPNVNVATEMVDLMNSSRAYEANLSVVRNAKQLASKALSIGK
jgi:flagellar basal-body rod protein FlgC